MGGRTPHHRSLLALQDESFIESRVPALIWPAETHKASLCTGNTHSALHSGKIATA